jgi:hypothetical protein
MFGLLDVQVERGNGRMLMGPNRAIRGNNNTIVGPNGRTFGDFNQVKTAE